MSNDIAAEGMGTAVPTEFCPSFPWAGAGEAISSPLCSGPMTFILPPSDV